MEVTIPVIQGYHEEVPAQRDSTLSQTLNDFAETMCLKHKNFIKYDILIDYLAVKVEIGSPPLVLTPDEEKALASWAVECHVLGMVRQGGRYVRL